MEKPIRRNRLVLISIIIILIATLSPSDGMNIGYQLDKVAHFSLFLILSINVCYKHIGQKNLLHILICAVLFGWGTELMQQVVLHITFQGTLWNIHNI